MSDRVFVLRTFSLANLKKDVLGCNDNVFQSYPCRQSQRNKKCQKCLITAATYNVVEKLSNLSEAQGTKRLPKFLTSNTCTCIYILNFHVCIQLHGYYILKPILCLQYCMQKCIESVVKGFEILRVKKKIGVGTSNSL